MKTKKQKREAIPSLEKRVKELKFDLEQVSYDSTKNIINNEIHKIENTVRTYEQDIQQPSSR